MTNSPAQDWIASLVHAADPRAALELALSELTNVQLAALRYDWARWWARPKQLLPPDPTWRSCGFLTGRGFGKTRSLSEFVYGEMASGRAMRVALCAQNEDKTIEVMVEGQSGLLAVAPSWDKPKWESGAVTLSNGAQARVFTPQEPQNIRGPEHHLVWASELCFWPAATRDEAMSNLRLGARLGYGRLVWDTTPKRRNPLIREMIERSRKNPDRHLIVTGSTYENAGNLTPEAIQEWEDMWSGTQKGAEELQGQYLDDSSGALFQAAWIEANRRPMPDKLSRRIISLDPAISTHRGSDCTGIIDQGLGPDRQIYVIRDMTGKHAPHEWAKLTLDAWAAGRCDCIVIERNRGGDTIAEVLRGAARVRGWTVTVVQKDAPVSHRPGHVYVKEVNAKGGKAVRAEAVATAYEKGLVSHVIGSDLAELETILTTWEPTPEADSPDALDALVHGVRELGLGDKPAPEAAFTGLAEAVRQIDQTHRDRGQGSAPVGIASLIPRSAWGSKL